MKNLTYIIASGAFMLLTALAATSCTEGNDWEVDASTSRLFSVSSISVPDRTATTAEVKWSSTPNTEYYIVEISRTAFDNDTPLGSNNSFVFGEDKSITQSPFTATGLDSDSEYYVRVKAMSSLYAESRWSYLTESNSSELSTFKTKAEQVANEMTNANRTSSSLTFTWNTAEAGTRLTRIELLKGSEVVASHNLTSDEISAGSYTFSGLTPNTVYSANLYNNDVRRGYWNNVATFPEAPAADVIEYLTTDDVVSAEYLATLAEAHPAASSFTLALPGDATFTIEEKLVIPDGMSINFFGLPGENKTKLILLSTVDYAYKHDYINFQNLEIDGTGTSGYVMNQSDTATVNRITFDDCIIRGFKTTFFRMQKGDKLKTVNHLTLNNCVFSNLGSGYYFIHIDADSGKLGVLNNLTITKCTFNNICATGKGFILSNKTNMTGGIRIEESTFYKVGGNTQYFIDFNSSANPATGISIKKCLMGATGGDLKGIRTKSTTPVIENTYATTEWSQTANAVTYTSFSGTAADLFVDPANGDFTVKDASIVAGDPRWAAE